MVLKKTQITEYFIKKLMDRLFKIAMFSSKASSSHNKETCLDEYYLQHSEENRMYSARFYDLLLECWKEWDAVFSESFRKIKDKAAKLRPLFPAKFTWLNHLQGREDANPNPNVSDRLGGSLTESVDPHLPSPILARPAKEQELSLQSPILPPVNKEELRKLMSESQAMRGTTKDMMSGMGEADFQLMFAEIYNPLRDNLRKMNEKKDQALQLRTADERLSRGFIDEMDYLEDLLGKFDDFGRKTIDFHTLMEFLGGPGPAAAKPNVRQSVQEHAAFDFDEPRKVQESDFGGPAAPRRESGADPNRNSHGFAIGTFGNPTNDFGFEGEAHAEPDLVHKPTASFRKKEAQGFHSNLSGVEHSKIKEFSAENLGEPGEGGDFDWHIESQKHPSKPAGSKVFDSFEPNSDAFFRKAQSVSGKTIDKEAKPAAAFTSKSQMKGADFSPSGFRPSNLESKESDFGAKSPKDPFSSAAQAKSAPNAKQQNFNFGKQASPEQDFGGPASQFDFGRHQASPFDEREDSDPLHTNFQANLQPDRPKPRPNEPFESDQMRAPQFGRPFPGNAPSAGPFSQPPKRPEPQFEEKKFPRKSPFQQNPFGGAGNDSPFTPEHDPHPAFGQEREDEGFRDYQDEPLEDPEESHMRRPNERQFGSQDRSHRMEREQDRFEFDYNDADRRLPPPQAPRFLDITSNFNIFYDPRKSPNSRPSAKNGRKTDDQRFKGSFRAESQGDGHAGPSSLRPRGEPFTEFDERLDQQSLRKPSDKVISNASSGNRMGFTFGGADQKRSRFDDPEILARIQEARAQDGQGLGDRETDQEHNSQNPKLKRIHLDDLNESRNESGSHRDLLPSRPGPTAQSATKASRNTANIVEGADDPMDAEEKALILELKNENEFLKQQCKLLHDQWTESTLRQEAKDSLRNSRPQSELSKRTGSKMVQSSVRKDGLYPSVVLDTEPDSRLKKAKQHKQVELLSQLNQQYALYIEALQKDLGDLIRKGTLEEGRATGQVPHLPEAPGRRDAQPESGPGSRRSHFGGQGWRRLG